MIKTHPSSRASRSKRLPGQKPPASEAGSVVHVRGQKPSVSISLPKRASRAAASFSTTAPSAEHLVPLASVETLGALIRKARMEQGHTQQKFADLVGVGRRFLSELEAGKPTLEVGKVLQVASAAGVSILVRE